MATLTDKRKGFAMALGIYVRIQGGAFVLHSNSMIQL